RDAERRLADQSIGAALADVERELDAARQQRRHADADRDLLAEPRRRSESWLERRARHEDVQLGEQARAIAAETPDQIFFGAFEVATKHAEPDDARRIGVGPHDAGGDVMEERHGRYNKCRWPASFLSSPLNPANLSPSG